MHYFILTLDFAGRALNTFCGCLLLFYIFNKFTKISFDYFCILLLLLLLFYCIIFCCFWDARDAAATPARHDLPNALTSRVRTERDSPLATCHAVPAQSLLQSRRAACCQRRCRLQRRQ